MVAAYLKIQQHSALMYQHCQMESTRYSGKQLAAMGILLRAILRLQSLAQPSLRQIHEHPPHN
jgi:hypothetical protein